jgi:hypothetical protein
MATILCALYDDPVEGQPASYARDETPAVTASGSGAHFYTAGDATSGSVEAARFGRA